MDKENLVVFGTAINKASGHRDNRGIVIFHCTIIKMPIAILIVVCEKDKKPNLNIAIDNGSDIHKCLLPNIKPYNNLKCYKMTALFRELLFACLLAIYGQTTLPFCTV